MVDGIPLSQIDPAKWHRNIAGLFQDFVRYPMSLAENLSLGTEIDPATLKEAAEDAGISDLVETLGWDTLLTRQFTGGAELSGGQWQRVALARALVAVHRGARLLILDEPTAQLDARAESDLYDRFLDVTRGVTTLVISHRFSTVRRASRIAVLAHGRITELGTHDELVALGGHYAQMFELQAARFRQ